MRLFHFENLRPVCPRCRVERKQDVPLKIASVILEEDEDIIEGVLHCSDPGCRLEYPIIDGIPLLIPGIRTYISDNLFQLTVRDDLSDTIESMLGDCAGPGTMYDAIQQYLSTYTWDHYGDLDPDEPQKYLNPGAVNRCLEQGLDLIDRDIKGPVLDIGCSVGRTTFALAEQCEGPVLGVDLNFSMLRIARNLLKNGVVSYPRRRVGIVYDRRKFDVHFNSAQRVDFWACDAMALPFTSDTFGFISALNVLDCVPSPRDFLEVVSEILRPSCRAILSTPYDWSTGVTPVESWIGGHSQRGPGKGASEPFLRSLLTPGAHSQSVNGLCITGEIEDFSWHTRLHDRSTVSYMVHLIAVQKTVSDNLDI